MHPWIPESGDKNLGVLRGVAGICGRSLYGGVYPERRQDPRALLALGCQETGPPAGRLRRLARRRGGVCRRRERSPLCPLGTEGSGHVSLRRADRHPTQWRPNGREPGQALVLVGPGGRGHRTNVRAENGDSTGGSAEGCSQCGKRTCVCGPEKGRERGRNGRVGRQAGATPGVGGRGCLAGCL